MIIIDADYVVMLRSSVVIQFFVPFLQFVIQEDENMQIFSI